VGVTHANEQCRDRGQHGQREDGRDDLGRVLGVGAENVVDLFALAVAQGLLVHDGRQARVGLQGDGEGGLVHGRRRAEGAQDYGGLEGGGGRRELDGQVGIFL